MLEVAKLVASGLRLVVRIVRTFAISFPIRNPPPSPPLTERHRAARNYSFHGSFVTEKVRLAPDCIIAMKHSTNAPVGAKIPTV